jgi:hypothetical protein
VPNTNPDLKPVTVWLPRELARQLDGHLAGQVKDLPGARASRHGWLLDLVRRALAEARDSNTHP